MTRWNSAWGLSTKVSSTNEWPFQLLDNWMKGGGDRNFLLGDFIYPVFTHAIYVFRLIRWQHHRALHFLRIVCIVSFVRLCVSLKKIPYANIEGKVAKWQSTYRRLELCPLRTDPCSYCEKSNRLNAAERGEKKNTSSFKIIEWLANGCLYEHQQK